MSNILKAPSFPPLATPIGEKYVAASAIDTSEGPSQLGHTDAQPPISCNRGSSAVKIAEKIEDVSKDEPKGGGLGTHQLLTPNLTRKK